MFRSRQLAAIRFTDSVGYLSANKFMNYLKFLNSGITIFILLIVLITSCESLLLQIYNSLKNG